MSFTNDPRPRRRTSAGVTRNTSMGRTPSVGPQTLLALLRVAASWLIGALIVLLLLDLIVHAATSVFMGLVPMMIILAFVRALRR